MPKSDNQKLKILYILDYLQKNSHEDHPVRANELIAMLDKHNIRADRKTIYSDVAALMDYGVDIVSLPGKNGGYYVASRNFELPELKLLIDAVQSSKYLTERKSRELIEKLCRECNEEDAKLIKRNVLVSFMLLTRPETSTVRFIRPASCSLHSLHSFSISSRDFFSVKYRLDWTASMSSFNSGSSKLREAM